MSTETNLWLIRRAPVDGPRGVIHGPDAPADISDAAAFVARTANLPAKAFAACSPARRTFETAVALGLDPVLAHLLVVVGASFSVGMPYVARFFDAKNRGFAMGIFGAGTTGAALNMFLAPLIVSVWGWQKVPQFYALVILVTAAFFWFFSYPDPGADPQKRAPLLEQLKVLRDPRVWKYCQYYSIVFGGFTGLSLWMTLSSMVLDIAALLLDSTHGRRSCPGAIVVCSGLAGHPSNKRFCAGVRCIQVRCFQRR